MAATSVTIRVEDETLESIDRNAARLGLNRTQYLLQWVPDTHKPSKTKPGQNTTQGVDARRSGSRSSRPRWS